MNNIFETGTTARHGRLLDYLIKSTFELFEKKEIINFSESSSLVYYGNKKELSLCELVNLDDITNTEKFTEDVMGELNIVTPDYMHFKNNKYLINKKETRVAGYPDLIAEVWSDDNSPADRAFKKYLYSTSPVTEQWYIEQDSNTVECYYGQKRIEDKNLADILVSEDGIKFDLRYLKL
ncbi:MAG: Uma2 family endonuclease [Oscillospiraceae bacterium]|nr:Uma2 family endonuclease [Oscillospiraceae bacterium]